MFKRIILSVFAALIVAGGASAVSAQWVQLGSKELPDRSNSGSWEVGKDKGEFKKVKLSVKDGKVDLVAITVKYMDGRMESFKCRGQIKAGGETREIDLTGKDRFILRVTAAYIASTNRGNTVFHATLWGSK